MAFCDSNVCTTPSTWVSLPKTILAAIANLAIIEIFCTL